MKRKLLAMAVAALTVASASAVPAKRLVKTVTQPDGTNLTVTQMGDERFHAFVTSDGLTVDFTPEGYAVYRATDGATAVYAHELSQRTADEKSFIAAKSTSLTFQANRAASPRYQAMLNNNTGANVKMVNNQGRISIEHQDSQVPHSGVAKIPILLVEYTDIKFKDSDPKSTFEQFFAGTEGVSAHQYFYEMSQGQYDPQFDVYGPYTLSKNRKYYGGSDYYGNDEKPGQMVKEAVQLANSEVDFSQYDNDGDGNCDVMIVLYAGVGQASSGVTSAVWPCQWTLSDSGAGAITCDGVTINDFAVFNELNGSNSSKIDGIGTFCHEFSHCLGLPDFYETTYSHGYYGMNEWSLLDYGCYNNDGYTPVGYTAYEKAFMGWLNLTEGVSNTQYTLPVLNNADDPQNFAVVLVNSKDQNEYFIFESRDQQGWDQYMSDKGMLITHVTYNASAWNNNTVNNSSLQRMTVVPADNKLTESTNSADLWPKSYATEFTNTSTPAAKTNTGSYLSRPITEITRDASTGAVTFWLEKEPIPTLSAPTINDTEVIEQGSFTASWEPVTAEDTDVTYTMQVWPKNSSMPAPELWSDFANGNPGNVTWTTSGYAKTYGTYVLLGTASQEGALTSAEKLAPENGVISIVANARSYGSDTGCTLVLSLLDSNGNTVASSDQSVTSTAGYVSCAFSGLDESQSYSVKFANSGSKKRISVYSIMAFAGDYSGQDDEVYDAALSELSSATTAPAREPSVETVGERITITGITDTSYTISNLEGDCYRFRVKAVPVDDTKAYESAWSTTTEVTFSRSGISDIVSEQPQAAWLIVNGQLVATPGARLFSVSGTEIKALSAGRFAPAPGAYILVTPGCSPAKIVL
jgi:M6 family metalloprotease-like protein